jgi:DNA mismatch endonuclease Vsr
MSGIRGKHTGPEMRVRKAAHALGLRFRLHRRDLPGTPDLVFPKLQVALFVNGCFGHRYEGCRDNTAFQASEQCLARALHTGCEEAQTADPFIAARMVVERALRPTLWRGERNADRVGAGVQADLAHRARLLGHRPRHGPAQRRLRPEIVGELRAVLLPRLAAPSS